MTTPTDAGTANNTPGGEGQAATEGVANAAATAAAATPGADDAKGNADANSTKPAEFKFTAPEGYELNEERLGEFKTLATDLKLTNESAQKLVDLATRAEVARAEAYAKQTNDWADEVRADKDLGGTKLAESAAVAKKAIDLGPPGLREFLNDSGLGNHPLVFKWAHAVGKALSEDRFVQGSGPASGKDMAAILYGKN